MWCKVTLGLILLAMMSFSSIASGLIVVANTDDTSILVEKREVRDIFMGNNSPYKLTPVVLTPNNDTRSVFNTKIVGLTESRIQSYWAQMRFSGRKKPPQEFDSVESVLAYVASKKGAVTYLPAKTKVPEGLTIIYQTD